MNLSRENVICLLFLAIETSDRPSTRPDVFERRNTDIINANQKWLAIQYGYCLHYSRKIDEAIQHCRQVNHFISS